MLLGCSCMYMKRGNKKKRKNKLLCVEWDKYTAWEGCRDKNCWERSNHQEWNWEKQVEEGSAVAGEIETRQKRQWGRKMKTVGGVKDEKGARKEKGEKAAWTGHLHPALSNQPFLINILCLPAAEGKGFKPRWKPPVMNYCIVIRLRESFFFTSGSYLPTYGLVSL